MSDRRSTEVSPILSRKNVSPGQGETVKVFILAFDAILRKSNPAGALISIMIPDEARRRDDNRCAKFQSEVGEVLCYLGVKVNWRWGTQ